CAGAGIQWVQLPGDNGLDTW
nr:immunoglobulin heavy chain junction region [Macaca mulatta]MOV59739.1 immunoglobulin heavy chain junction region [Macaca mulatta]MOV60015.1 immunoglobulin heavy chain junction region [Macaca mulatta]